MRKCVVGRKIHHSRPSAAKGMPPLWGRPTTAGAVRTTQQQLPCNGKRTRRSTSRLPTTTTTTTTTSCKHQMSTGSHSCCRTGYFATSSSRCTRHSRGFSSRSLLALIMLVTVIAPHPRTCSSNCGSSVVVGASGITRETGLAADRGVQATLGEEGRGEEWSSHAADDGPSTMDAPAFTISTKAFTYRALSAAHPDGLSGVTVETIRDSCPFAQEPDSPQADDFWDRSLSNAIISLGPPDEASGMSARDIYDVLDGVGTILACCPGLLLDPEVDADTPAESDSSSSASSSSGSSSSSSSRGTRPALATCGLLGVSIEGTSGLAAAGEDGSPRGNVGFELTVIFSSVLRAARLPSVALDALHGAAGLTMTDRQRAAWETERALVWLQLGRVGEAVAGLKSALRWDAGDFRALQPLGAALVAQGSVAEGFQYLREAAELQKSRIATVFEQIVRNQGLEPSILETKNQKEVLVTQRNWMAMFLGWALQGRWKKLGGSVHVLRRVDNFLRRHFSADSEISFMLGRELSKRGFQKESWHYLTSAAAPWNRQIYRIRSALSIPTVASSEQDLALAMATLEGWLTRQETPIEDSPETARHDEHRTTTTTTTSGGGEFETPLSSCSFGALNYPDVAFDSLPLLAFADHRYPRRNRGGLEDDDDDDDDDSRRSPAGGSNGRGDGDKDEGVPPRGFSGKIDGDAWRNPGSAAAAAAAAAAGKGLDEDGGDDADRLSLYGSIGRLFSRLCPDLGAFVAPWLDRYGGAPSLAPEADGGLRGVADGRVRVVFVSSRFGNHATTKTLAALMRLLPRQHFEVILGSWPTPSDDWTEEHVLGSTESRSANLVFNRTASLQKLAHRRPDVVVFADAPFDAKTYFLAFGRVAPVQIALWGHAPTLGIGSIDYYVVPEPLVADAWLGNDELQTVSDSTGEGEALDDDEEEEVDFLFREGPARAAGSGDDGGIKLPAVRHGGDASANDGRGRGGLRSEIWQRRRDPPRGFVFSEPPARDFAGAPLDPCDDGSDEEPRNAFRCRNGLPPRAGGSGPATGAVEPEKRVGQTSGAAAAAGAGAGAGVEAGGGRAGSVGRGGMRLKVGMAAAAEMEGEEEDYDDDDDDEDDDDDNMYGIFTEDGDLVEYESLVATLKERGKGREELERIVSALLEEQALLDEQEEGGGDANEDEGGWWPEEDGERGEDSIAKENQHGQYGDVEMSARIHQRLARSRVARDDGARNGAQKSPARSRQEDVLRRHVIGPGRLIIAGEEVDVGYSNGGDDDGDKIFGGGGGGGGNYENDFDEDDDDHEGLYEEGGLFVDEYGRVFDGEVFVDEFGEAFDGELYADDFGDAFDGVYEGVLYDDDDGDGDGGGVFFFRNGDESLDDDRGFADDNDYFEEHYYGDDRGCDRSGGDWPSPWAGVDYADTVEEQVVLLESLGAFVQPPGWGGRLGSGRLARLADASEMRRRHLLPEMSYLAVLPIPVYHFHPDFDVAVGMLLERHPSIHVVVVVEETTAEALRTEGEFYQHDHLQYASPPLWTEKLRSRLAARLGENVWRMHLLPPVDSWDYFAILGVADVVLDPFPVGNLHAAVDAFALGTPVVTLPSRQRAGARYVQALASDLGLPASCCAAATLSHYVDLAARLCLDEEWADEVSDILYAVRDWVYLTPEAPRENPHSKQPPQPQPQPDRFSGGDHHQRSREREGCGDADGSDPPRAAAQRGGRCSAWARGRRHVREWAGFLWRVSRPGVPVEFTVDLRQECGAQRNHYCSAGRRPNACGSCAARRKAEKRAAAAAAGAAAG